MSSGGIPGVDLDIYYPIERADKDSIYKKYNLDPKMHYVATVARICKDKGIPKIIEASKLLLNEKISFLLIGSFDTQDAISNSCKEELIQAPNIILLGKRQKSEINELFAVSDAFLLPTKREGYGLSICEAMCTGLPVIVSNIDGPKEFVRNNIDGLLINQENEKEIAESVKIVCNKVVTFDSKRILDYSREKFNSTKIINEISNEILLF